MSPLREQLTMLLGATAAVSGSDGLKLARHLDGGELAECERLLDAIFWNAEMLLEAISVAVEQGACGLGESEIENSKLEVGK